MEQTMMRTKGPTRHEEKSFTDRARKCLQAKVSWDNDQRAFDDDVKSKEEESRGADKYPWWYVLSLIGVGSAEWMINYSSFLEALSVPLFAAGLTLAVAGFVAFASHHHGALWKQPGLREDLKNTSGTKWLTGTTIGGLLLALAIVGWARYVWVADLTALGVDVAVWPRVVIGLGGNIIVWALGCTVAYIAHSIGQYTKKIKNVRKTKDKFDRKRDRLLEARDKLHTYYGDDNQPLEKLIARLNEQYRLEELLGRENVIREARRKRS